MIILSWDVKMSWNCYHCPWKLHDNTIMDFSYGFYHTFMCISLLISTWIVHDAHFIGTTYENLHFKLGFEKDFKQFSWLRWFVVMAVYIAVCILVHLHYVCMSIYLFLKSLYIITSYTLTCNNDNSQK